MWRQWTGKAVSLISSTDKHGETQGWYIWLSNKRTHEGPNIWWSTKGSWTVCLVVTEIGSYKLPGKTLGCRIQEGNWRAVVEFPPTQGMNVSQTVLSVVTLGLFSKELRKFEWRAGWVLSPNHLHYGRVLTGPVEGKLSCWFLLVLETRCGGCRVQEEVPEKIILPWIPSFLYFSVFNGIMWAFCEYISPKFSMICLIQQENK